LCSSVVEWAAREQSIPAIRDGINRLAAIDEYLDRTSIEGRAQVAAAMRHMSGMIDRVLRGEHPGEIPVARVFQPELVVNFAVARDIRISIPSGFVTHAR
jgi:hypothetical protein